ncbi:MAG: hypothetical protein ABI568_08430 [Pseudarthrobacter sp.]
MIDIWNILAWTSAHPPRQHRRGDVRPLIPRAQWINPASYPGYLEPADGDTEHPVTLRNDAYRKAVAHAKEFLFGSR